MNKYYKTEINSQIQRTNKLLPEGREAVEGKKLGKGD